MLGVPPLSRTPTDVSQRSFGGVLQRGVGTPHTASSVRSYTITTNRIPSVHDMQGKAYGIRDVAPWVDCDFEIPGKPLGGGGSGVRDGRRGLTMRSTGWRLGRVARSSP